MPEPPPSPVHRGRPNSDDVCARSTSEAAFAMVPLAVLDRAAILKLEARELYFEVLL